MTKEHLISFRDGSYKKISAPKEWKHSQWIHYMQQNGDIVRINPRNVNYIEEISMPVDSCRGGAIIPNIMKL